LANTAGGALAQHEPSEARSGVSNGGVINVDRTVDVINVDNAARSGRLSGKSKTVQESLGIDYLPGISCNQRR
jgi:hypothetical protein